MTSEHPSTTLRPPPPKARPRSRDYGAIVAKVFCFLFALVGVLPVAAGAVVRSGPARRWAVHETTRLLREQGIIATYDVNVRLWPLSLELRSLTVQATDGGSPVLVSPRVSVRPRVFALLSGKLAIDQIEVDAPTARVVIKDGKLANLGVVLPKSSGGAIHAPFSVFSISDASIDLDVDGTTAKARDVDLDVTADDDPGRGSSFEIAVRAGETDVVHARAGAGNGVKGGVDDDALCNLEARVRVEPDEITVRRLTAKAVADLDGAPGTSPGCRLASDDKRNVELAMNHLRVRLPAGPAAASGAIPDVDGHVHVRAPLALARRFVPLPDADGWVGVDADVRLTPAMTIPDVAGHIEAHGIRIDHFRFAQELQGEVTVRAGIVTSPLLTVKIAEGMASLTDVTVNTNAPGAPLKAKLDVRDVSFTSLLRDLGVHPHPYVGWELREIHLPSLTGTLAPLHLDGDFSGNEGGFEVDDMPHENPAHQKIFGTKEVQLHAHLSVRPYGVEFKQVQAKLPKSTLENGFVSLHFNNDLHVEVPIGKIDLADCTPLGTIALAGQVDVAAHVTGNFGDPHLEADATIKDFVFGDIPFGNVTSGHASLTGLVLELKNVRAQKGHSGYEMPSARLDFGQNGMRMDAQFGSTELGLRDFLALWHMDEDPRFEGIDALLETHGRLRVALGGPEDACDSGFFDVHATAHATDVDLFGERFDEGDADFEYRWTDRLAGIDGADLDLRAFTLHKTKTKAGPILGAVLGSGTITRGGKVNGSVLLQAIPLSRMQSLGPIRESIEGAVSGTVQMSGKLESYVVTGDVDVTPTRIRGAAFGPSHFSVEMTQDEKPQHKIGVTHCGAPIYAGFDKEAYLKDTSSQGHYLADGDLLGGQVHLDHVSMSRQRAPLLSGRVGMNKLDVGDVITAMSAPTATVEGERAPERLDGELTGDLILDHVSTDDIGHSRARFMPAALWIARGGQKVVLRPTKEALVLDADVLTLPALTLDLEAPGGLKGALVVQGDVAHLSKAPELSIGAELEPIDLGLLVGVVPKLERSQGTLSGRLLAKGKIGQPQITGELHVKGGEIAMRGWPSPVTELNVDAMADAQELRIASGSAKFAGGTLAVTGSMPLKHFAFDKVDARVLARDVHLSPLSGVNATTDADLSLSWSGQATGSPTASLLHVGGEVTITSFEYAHPINLELNAPGLRATRTKVDTYDPSLDKIAFDGLRVRARTPLRIHNNLAEVLFDIDSGALVVSGTDQRMGLRGSLRAKAGGRFRFRGNDFDVHQAVIRFDDPTRIDPNVDLVAVTEYRRYTDTSAAAAAGGTGGGGLWRITLHAYGDAENLRLDMTSDPPLSQEDIVLLLTIGMTHAEVDQLQAGAIGTTIALEALSSASGADRAVTKAIPVIDDFHFGSAYSTLTGRTEPQLVVGKRLTDNLRANVATTLAEDRELRSNIEWRLNRTLSVLGSYDSINDVSSSAIGNIGVDLRFRLEFE
jgi:translocation and assembly module TamB